MKWQGARLAGQQVFTAGLKGGSDVVQREIGKIGVRFWHRLAAITNRTRVLRQGRSKARYRDGLDAR